MKFSTFDIKAPTTYGVIQPGNYDATVSECTWKQNSSGTGEIIAVKFTIIGPSYNNRVVFSNFNIRNSSPRAEEIGQQQFSDFARACGFDRIEDDTDAYVGKDINIKIGVEDPTKVEPGKEQRNIVLAYKRCESTPAPEMPSPAPAKSGTTVPPWARK